MKSKIFCVIIIASVFCSIFAISASAQDEYVLEAGSYMWNNTLSLDADFTNETFNFPISVSGSVILDNGQPSFDPSLNASILQINVDTNSEYPLTYIQGIDTYYPVYSTTEGWDSLYYTFLNGFSVDIPGIKGYGQFFTVASDITLSSSQYSWVINNITPVFPILSSGYYRLILPIDIAEPTWIGDRNTVWYNIRGRVITNDSNRALSFYRLGIRYFVNDGADYGAGVWGIELRVDTYTDTNLEVMSITFDRNTNQFYLAYNDLVLDSFIGLAIDGDYEISDDFFSLFNELFEPYDYVYTGNPWFDIVDGVVDALKIDVFGDFSPWDILVTFIGISVFIWLLKLLAGG